MRCVFLANFGGRVGPGGVFGGCAWVGPVGLAGLGGL